MIAIGVSDLLVLGVDPGCTGAVTIIDQKGDAESFCFENATEAEIGEFMCDCKRISVRCFAALESVHSMPKQGVSSTFKFGKAYGFIRGVLIAVGIPFEDVTPQKWQKELGCLTKGDKNISRAKAQQLFPGLKMTNKTCDSVCIAEYARRLYHSRNGT